MNPLQVNTKAQVKKKYYEGKNMKRANSSRKKSKHYINAESRAARKAQ